MIRAEKYWLSVSDYLLLTLKWFWSPDWNHPIRAIVSDWPWVQWLFIILINLRCNLNASLHVKIDQTNLFCNIPSIIIFNIQKSQVINFFLPFFSIQKLLFIFYLIISITALTSQSLLFSNQPEYITQLQNLMKNNMTICILSETS